MIVSFLQVVAALLLVVGSLFILTAAIGLLRLPDVYARMHAASKAGTVGSCVILIAAALAEMDLTLATRVLAAAIFFVITAPISAHLLARAALQAGYPMSRESNCDERTQLSHQSRAARD